MSRGTVDKLLDKFNTKVQRGYSKFILLEAYEFRIAADDISYFRSFEKQSEIKVETYNGGEKWNTCQEK